MAASSEEKNRRCISKSDDDLLLDDDDDDDIVVERETASELTAVEAHGVTSLDEEAIRLARKRLERIMLCCIWV